MGTRHDIWAPPPPPAFGDSVVDLDMSLFGHPRSVRREVIRTASVVSAVVLLVFTGGFAAAYLSGAMACPARETTAVVPLFSLEELRECVAGRTNDPTPEPPPTSPTEPTITVPEGVSSVAPEPVLSPAEREQLEHIEQTTLARARRMFLAGRTIDALQAVRGLVAGAQASAAAHQLMAEILLERRDLPAAEAAVRQALQQAPDDADLLLTAAVIARDRQDSAQAVERFRRYLERAPSGRYAAVARQQLDLLERAAQNPPPLP